MRKAFAGLATLQLLVIVAQFCFAATGAFSTAPREESYRPHHAMGYVIFVVAVVVTVVAALARMPARRIGLPALVVGLTSAQVLIAELAKDAGGPVFAGLHALTGLAILALAVLTLRYAVRD